MKRSRWGGGPGPKISLGGPFFFILAGVELVWGGGGGPTLIRRPHYSTSVASGRRRRRGTAEPRLVLFEFCGRRSRTFSALREDLGECVRAYNLPRRQTHLRLNVDKITIWNDVVPFR